MGHIQLLMTAMSLIAAAGGAYGAERLFDRYGRAPEVQQDVELLIASAPDEDDTIREA